MRIGAMILGILGGLINAVFGAFWILGAAAARAFNEGTRASLANAHDVQAQGTAGYLLVAGLVAGIAGAVLAGSNKGRAAAGVMLLAGVAPAFLVPKAIGVSAVLLVGGLLALGVKPRAAGTGAPALATR